MIMDAMVGKSFEPEVFLVNRDNLVAYAEASGDHNPIHLDETFAKSVGLPDVIAHGMYTMALAGQAVRKWLGNDKEIIEFSTRFTKPVVVPANEQVRVIFTGRISEVEEREMTLEVNALCNDVKVLGLTKVRIRL